ncbi:MAG: methylenetetrahydrofolate reductase [Lentisphaerae bacterium]|nr:methylenetetrahydrofolate reductase [Lentisphaerota bacterium]
MTYHDQYTTLHVELLTPKQNSKDLDGDLEKFMAKYNTIMDAGYIASITDNPMGLLSFQATEIIPELELEVKPDQLLMHLNTFHTREALDEILTAAADMGIKYLLPISGDGNERLPKLSPESIGFDGKAVTSVELLSYIHQAYPDRFVCGVAFNPYEPQDHEMAKMQRKIDAGAAFIVTQPVIGNDQCVKQLIDAVEIPVIIDAWMSKKLYLLSECVGYEIPEDHPYDPLANLKELQASFPGSGLYLALRGMKTQLPILDEVLKTA